MFGWFKRASQKTSLFNLSIVTKTLIEVCNRGYESSGGTPDKLPDNLRQKIIKSRDNLLKEIEVAQSVEIPLSDILKTIDKASAESKLSPLADNILGDIIINA